MDWLRNTWERLTTSEWLRRITGGRPELALMAAPALLVIAAVIAVVAVFAFGGDGDEDGGSQAVATVTATAEATPTPVFAGILTPGAEVQNQIKPEDLQRPRGAVSAGSFTGDRLVIPSIEVNANFTLRTVGSDGKMANPNGPTDVAYYDFSTWPGLGGFPGVGGNSVFSGHVDYRNYGPAVFWRLRELQPGDRIEVRMSDGRAFTYEVRWNKSVPADTAPWGEIVASTATESVTLITCGGTFDPGSRQYDNRQVVWAERVS